MRIKNRSLFKSQAPEYKIENKKTTAGDETTIYIYDEVSPYWGISAEQIVRDLEAIKGGTIHIRINSPGGAVFDGVAIYNAIKQHKAKTITHIDGLAASISSIIAMAGDEVEMAANAFFMIHEPWSMVVGNAGMMREEASLLEKIEGSIIDTYAVKSGKDQAEIKAWMEKETWFTATEAKAAGFVDRIFEESIVDKATVTLFDLSIFMNTPDNLLTNKDLNPRELENALRDAGCSRKQAKEILAKGLGPAEPPARDAQEAPPEPLRDAEPALPLPERGRDRTTELLIKAKTIKR